MRSIYLLSSFFAGFSLMTFEMTASRLLAPIVGNSIFSWTSIIGVIIFGLALGSFCGGLFADKFKSKIILGYVFGLSSVLILLTTILSGSTDFLLNFNLGILWTSVIVSFYLLFIPSIFIGAILPIILKLYFKDEHHLGQEYGLLSAFWSFGSILGVFVTGFYLISTFGSLETLYAVAAGLFVLSFIFLIKEIKQTRTIVFIIFNITFFVISFLHIASQDPDKDIIMEKETKYYYARIAQSPIFGGSEILFLDFDSHSIITKNSTGRIYTDIYPVFKHLNENLKKILVVGAGAYTLPISIKNYYPNSTVEVVELDEELEKIGVDFFNLNTDEIITHTEDARIYIKKTKEKYDLVFGDAYNSFISVPWHLTTFEFNNEVKNILNKDGIYAMNFIGSTEGENSDLFKSIRNTFEKTFPNYYIFTFGNNPSGIQNIILVGLNNKENYLDIETFRKKIFGGKYGPVLASRLIKNPEFIDGGLVLTDNFAPVEKMMIKPMKDYFHKNLENYAYLLNI